MDTNEKPKRPWWKRKRTWAAGSVLAAVAYPVSFGPAQYANIRGWVPNMAVGNVYWPLVPATRYVPGFEAASDWYAGWWIRLALRHEASRTDP